MIESKIKIKPLSVNMAWQGKRFKTPAYNIYENACLLMLPAFHKIPLPPFELYYDFGMSNMASDLDNPVKLFTDILQKKYGFDDKNIMRLVVNKTIVDKGSEYVYFKINSILQ